MAIEALRAASLAMIRSVSTVRLPWMFQRAWGASPPVSRQETVEAFGEPAAKWSSPWCLLIPR
jgi:hypothetical protein